MFMPYEQLYASIKGHQEDLLRDAAQDRLIWEALKSYNGWARRMTCAVGHWLIVIGTRLETRYSPAMQHPSGSQQVLSA